MVGIKIKVVTLDNLIQEIQRKRTKLNLVERAAALSAEQVRAEAVRTLQGGTRSGRASPRPGGTVHIASAPGEPLKSDTGHLASHIFARVGKNFAEVGTSVSYGKFWEVDVSPGKRRPWLGPSFNKHKEAIIRRMAAATKRAMNG